MTGTFDAVVVGAGPNGLVAANLLADAGWSVVVLEATEHPGGAVRSADDYPAPGFTADLFSAFYPLAAASPVVQAMRLEEHGLRWVHAPTVLAHVLDDGRGVLLSRDLDETAASVDEFAPGDGDAWRRWVERWREVERPVLDALLHPFPPVRPALSMARRLGVARALRLARTSVLPARRFVAEEFRGEGAALLVAGNAMHTDLAPEAAGSALVRPAARDARAGARLPGAAGRVRPADRRSRLPAAGPRRSAALLGTGDVGRARRVRRRGRRARVRRAGPGPPRSARRRTRAAPLPLDGRHRPPPPRLRHDLDRFQWDSATVKVNWAVSGPIPWRSEAARRAGTVHLGGGLDDLTRCGADLATGTVPERPFVLFGQMTTTDPTRSPAGTESAWAYAHLPRDIGTPEVVADFVRRIEDEVERQAPGFRDVVLARTVQSSADLEDADPSLDGGALNGGTAALHQQLVFRPTPGLGRPDTPFPGLFLAGSSAHPGGGVHGACGANAARAALLRGRVGARLYDASVGAAQRFLS